MTRRIAAMYLGSIVCIAWAVLTAWAFIHAAMRRDDDVPEDDVQPWDMPTTWTFTGGPSVTVRTNDQTYTYASGGSRDWRN